MMWLETCFFNKHHRLGCAEGFNLILFNSVLHYSVALLLTVQQVVLFNTSKECEEFFIELKSSSSESDNPTFPKT